MPITRINTYTVTDPSLLLGENVDLESQVYICTYPGRSYETTTSEDGLVMTTVATFDSQEIVDQFDADEIVILYKQKMAQYFSNYGITVEVHETGGT